MQQALRVGPRLLILGTNGAGSDEVPDVFVQFRPPELPLDKLACSGSSRVSRREGSMSPLQHLRTQTVRDKEAPRRAITWSWLLQLGPLDSRLNIPLDGGHHPGSGENGFWNGLPLLWLKLSRECIWFEILGTWAIGKSEVKSVKKEGPTSLSRIQPLSLPDVSEVSVVRPYEKRVFGPLQPMPPLFQCHFNGQQLPVPNIIISLSWSKPTREKCTRVKLVITPTPL